MHSLRLGVLAGGVAPVRARVMKWASEFEDLLAWQKARALVTDIYRLTQQPPLSRDFGLRDQMQRAGISIMSNIAEGFGYINRAQFVRFLSMALGSCAELRSQLYIARAVGYIDMAAFDQYRRQAEEVGRMIGALRLSTIGLIKKSNHKEKVNSER